MSSGILHPQRVERREIRLRCGTLHLQVEQADWPLEALCGFASRRNHKRGFLIVSKVLGKHIPVRPSLMRLGHARLADSLQLVAGPAVFIALAETATGLGHGIFEQVLMQTGRDDLLFLHTTRYRLDAPLALAFDEIHSHAPDHLLYEPADPDSAELFRTARSLVLIDDEMSTGRTLGQLASAYRALHPHLQEVHLVSLTNWLDEKSCQNLREQIGLPLHFHQVLRGQFTFVADPAFDPGPPPDVTGTGQPKDQWLSTNYGRRGLRQRLTVALPDKLGAEEWPKSERILVLGSGEFAHAPYRLAQELEDRGHDVWYQSTTRSPILVGEDIQSALTFVDNYYDNIPNFVYNVADRVYDRIVIGYETNPLPPEHDLSTILKAHSLFF